MNIIAAVSRNGVIGVNGGIPWRIEEDLKRFRQLTTGGIVIMGRRTYQGILAYTGGKPLKDRTNIVISSDWESVDKNSFYGMTDFNNLVKVNSVIEAVEHADDLRVLRSEKRPIWCIGGESIYRQMLHFVSHLYITMVDIDITEDAGKLTYFPFTNPADWSVKVAEERYKTKSGLYVKNFIYRHAGV